MSVALPLPSSPHCAPSRTNAGIVKTFLLVYEAILLAK
jgi:hypothetical protein